MFEMFHQAAKAETPIHPSQKLFLIELQQAEKTPDGSFLPASRLQINSVFRTSGLLLALPPEELKSLVFLLSFVSPNGDCRAMLPQLAAAMHLSPGMARSKMKRLLGFRWQGESLVLETRAESGLVAYALHPRLVDYVEAQEPEKETETTSTIQAASRGAVIEYSRRHYARTRTEAEREIARQLGHEMPEGEEDAALPHNVAPLPEQATTSPSSAGNAPSLRRRLENNGLTTEQADKLIATYSLQRIEQQLGWLPFRNAKNPAAFLTAAIEGSYEEPRLLRRHRGKQNHKAP